MKLIPNKAGRKVNINIVICAQISMSVNSYIKKFCLLIKLWTEDKKYIYIFQPLLHAMSSCLSSSALAWDNSGFSTSRVNAGRTVSVNADVMATNAH